jgi:hypothetical protein
MFAILGINLIVWSVNNQIRQTEASVIVPSLYSAPTTWNMVTYVSTFLFLFPGLIMINHTGNEFNFKTSRQNIIDGWQRKDFISVKILFAVVLSLTATIMVFLTGLLLGFLSSQGNNTPLFENSQYLLYFFLQTLLYCIVAIFIVFWIRRSGLAIGIYFAYSLVIENLLAGLVFWLLRNNGNTRFSQLFPLQSSDSLIQTPRLKDIMPGQNFSPVVLVVLVCFYIILFCWLSYRSFTRRDL